MSGKKCVYNNVERGYVGIWILYANYKQGGSKCVTCMYVPDMDVSV